MSLDAIGIIAQNMKQTVEFYKILDVDIKDIGAGEDHLEATTPSGIRDQLESFSTYMEKSLSSKYLAQVDEWIDLTEKKGIYEQVEITKLDFDYNKSGVFHAKVLLRRDRRENAEFLGTAMEKVEMTMNVQQPKPGQAWTFRITNFSKKTM